MRWETFHLELLELQGLLIIPDLPKRHERLQDLERLGARELHQKSRSTSHSTRHSKAGRDIGLLSLLFYCW